MQVNVAIKRHTHFMIYCSPSCGIAPVQIFMLNLLEVELHGSSREYLALPLIIF